MYEIEFYGRDGKLYDASDMVRDRPGGKDPKETMKLTKDDITGKITRNSNPCCFWEYKNGKHLKPIFSSMSEMNKYRKANGIKIGTGTDIYLSHVSVKESFFS